MRVTIFVTAALALGLSACGERESVREIPDNSQDQIPSYQCDTDEQCEALDQELDGKGYAYRCEDEDAVGWPCTDPEETYASE